jgi:hypothetical protein
MAVGAPDRIQTSWEPPGRRMIPIEGAENGRPPEPRLTPTALSLVG